MAYFTHTCLDCKQTVKKQNIIWLESSKLVYRYIANKV